MVEKLETLQMDSFELSSDCAPSVSLTCVKQVKIEDPDCSQGDLCCFNLQSTEMGNQRAAEHSGSSVVDPSRAIDHLCPLPATKKVGKFRFLGGAADRSDISNQMDLAVSSSSAELESKISQLCDMNATESSVSCGADSNVESTNESDMDEPISKVRRSSRIRTLEDERILLGRRFKRPLNDVSKLISNGKDDVENVWPQSNGVAPSSRHQMEFSTADDHSLSSYHKGSEHTATDYLSSTTVSLPEGGLKLKSRWLKTAEIHSNEDQSDASQDAGSNRCATTEFISITENIFLDRGSDRKNKDRMVCECVIPEEGWGCDEDCLNRLLYVECGSRCPCGNFCANKRFQKKIYANVEAKYYGDKGFGLRAMEALPSNTFIIEYVGEVLNSSQFRSRVKTYSKDADHKHHYFMALSSDQIIDATLKGNISRFINHSCAPNCETQKWTVNGQLRIGLFTLRHIEAGEELTFDYQFQRYGRDAQKCLCGTAECRGYIGGDSKTEVEIISGPKSRGLSKRTPFEDLMFEKELEELKRNQSLRNSKQVLTLCRLMVRAEGWKVRSELMEVLKKSDESCLRLFVDYHGLSLLWSWMVDEQSDSPIELASMKLTFLGVLELLPIPHSNLLKDSKVLQVVQRWTDSVDVISASQRCELVDKEVKAVLSRVLNLVCEEDETSETIIIDDDFSEQVHDMNVSIRDVAVGLLNKWSSLKEYFKIPKKLETSVNDSVESRRSPELKKSRHCSSPVNSRDRRSQRRSPDRKSIVQTFGYNLPKMSYSENSRHDRRKDFSAGMARPLTDAERREKRKKIEEKSILKSEDEANQRKQDDFDYECRMLENQLGMVAGMAVTSNSMVGMSSSSSDVGSSIATTDDVTRLPPGAYPGTLVLDPNTKSYWWQDQVSKILVYQASSAQVEAVLAEDFSSVPQFYSDPEAGLIHEIKLVDGSDGSDGQVASGNSPSLGTNDEDGIPPKAAKIIASLRAEIESLKQQLRDKEGTTDNSLNSPASSSVGGSAVVNENGPVTPSKLPPFWKMAYDGGEVYYYHTKTKATSWDPPQWNDEDAAAAVHESTEDSNVVHQPEESSAVVPPMVNGHSNGRKHKEHFKQEISNHIVKVLRTYRSADSLGVVKITSDEDFKYLARKLTHAVMEKELRLCKEPGQLKCTSSVISKAKEYVKKYMRKAGPIHQRSKHSPDQTL